MIVAQQTFSFYLVPYTKANSLGLTPFGPPMCQVEADTELTMSASPVTAVGQFTLTMANWRYCTVHYIGDDGGIIFLPARVR